MLRGRTNGTGNETRFVWGQRREFVGGFSSVGDTGEIDFTNDLFWKIEITQAYQTGLECIGLDDVRAGFEVLSVEPGDLFRVRQSEHVGAVFQIVRPVFETFAPNLLLGQTKTKDHRTHRAIKDQNLFFETAEEKFRLTSILSNGHNISCVLF